MFKALVVVFIFLCCMSSISAQSTFPQGSAEGTTELSNSVGRVDIPLVDLSVRQPETNSEVAFSVQVLLLLTVLTLAPSILILCTTFLRFSIVLNFVKTALSLQSVPSTTVLNGIALFMTLFVMWPTFTTVYNEAYKPLSDGELGITEAVQAAESPIRVFMYGQMADNTDYIKTFMSIADMPKPQTLADVPTYILIPSYILHELTIAFKIGVLLYIPFIVIDMVVASILMSMGMIMLPPVQISMPFKLMLFVLVDGWGLLTQQLFTSIIK
ncbi:MAG: flagellar biosynthetic protein FliP [Treponema sp. CETP13]|nr:MAG: flagellar biosynthetic protein FliP [Treponema sp. CETP13]